MQISVSKISDIKEDVKDFGFSSNLKTAFVSAFMYIWAGRSRDIRDLELIEECENLTPILDSLLLKINQEGIEQIKINLELWGEALEDKAKELNNIDEVIENRQQIALIGRIYTTVKAYLRERKTKQTEVIDIHITKPVKKHLTPAQIKFLCAIARNWNNWTGQKIYYTYGDQMPYVSALNQIILIMSDSLPDSANFYFWFVDNIRFEHGKSIIDAFTSGKIKEYALAYKAQVA